MRVLIWQWGRRGAMPRFALELAEGCDALAGLSATLWLAAQAEILPHSRCNLTLATYRGTFSCLLRLLTWPLLLAELLLNLRKIAPDIAIGVHAGPLDPIMALALRLRRIPFHLIVHDATAHPGDRQSVMHAQHLTLTTAAGAIVLSSHVEASLRAKNRNLPIIRASHPPLHFGPPPPRPGAHGGRLRLLFFGRLLPYKGLDLLADAADRLGPRANISLRVVGEGAPSVALTRLAQWPWVVVENRWVPEPELASLLAWADGVVLPYTEASQSGVAAAAIAARRWVIASQVGGLAEQCLDYRAAILCAPEPQALVNAIEAMRARSPNLDDLATDWAQNSWTAMARGLLEAIASQPLSKRAP